MRRFTFLRPVVVVVLLGVLAPYAQPVAVAQEATPEAEEMMSEGATDQLVMLATGVDLASPFDVSTIRLTFEPGGRTVSPIALRLGSWSWSPAASSLRWTVQ